VACPTAASRPSIGRTSRFGRVCPPTVVNLAMFLFSFDAHQWHHRFGRAALISRPSTRSLYLEPRHWLVDVVPDASGVVFGRRARLILVWGRPDQRHDGHGRFPIRRRTPSLGISVTILRVEPSPPRSQPARTTHPTFKFINIFPRLSTPTAVSRHGFSVPVARCLPGRLRLFPSGGPDVQARRLSGLCRKPKKGVRMSFLDTPKLGPF
jgi:hypothetical protein